MIKTRLETEQTRIARLEAQCAALLADLKLADALIGCLAEQLGPNLSLYPYLASMPNIMTRIQQTIRCKGAIQ